MREAGAVWFVACAMPKPKKRLTPRLAFSALLGRNRACANSDVISSQPAQPLVAIACLDDTASETTTTPADLHRNAPTATIRYRN